MLPASLEAPRGYPGRPRKALLKVICVGKVSQTGWLETNPLVPLVPLVPNGKSMEHERSEAAKVIVFVWTTVKLIGFVGTFQCLIGKQ